MGDEAPQTNEGVADNPGKESSRVHASVLWVGILSTYLLLFGVSGYIGFFQEPYNPAVNPSERALKLLENQEIRGQLRDGLKQEW
jgi:hypothetical protein